MALSMPTQDPNGSLDPDFSVPVERILTTAELRGPHPFLGPLSSSDLSTLSQLCLIQSSRRDIVTASGLGFSDVDPSLTGQLVLCLQRHVTLASSVDLVKEGFMALHKLKENEMNITMDQWVAQTASVLLERLRLGLEAAAILLYVVTSPGIDRTVVNEDAIEATIVLFRHHLSKNILPALNQIAHSVPPTSQPDSAARTLSMSAKKRRRSSTEDAMDTREMRKIYRPLAKTVGLTVLIMERLEVLVQKIPLDDQHLLNVSAGAMVSFELDPTYQSDFKIAHQCHAASVGVITSIFRRYPRHRQLIIGDLFPVMLKLPTYKRSIRTFPVQSSSVLYPSGIRALSKSLSALPESNNIQTITALVLSLVQSTVVRPELINANNHQSDDTQQNHSFKSGLRECKTVTEYFVAQLLQRCSKKGEDGGASEFRPILANIIDDLLLVLLVPEYPAAEMLLLSITNKISMDLLNMCSSTKITAENTYMNTILDGFGKICAAEARVLKFHREKPVRMRTQSISDKVHNDCYCQGKSEELEGIVCSRCRSSYHAHCVGLSQETAPPNWFCDSCQLGRIVDFEQDRNVNLGELGCSRELIDESFCMHRLLVDYLSIVTRKTGMVGIKDAYEFHLAQWLSELKPSETSGKETEDGQSQPSTLPLAHHLIELWDPRESSDLNSNGQLSLNGMLHCLSDEGRSRLVVHLASTQAQLLISHRSQIGLFVNQLMENRNAALLRKLALKAIEKVTDADPMLMIYPFIRKAVTKRFSDEAISVREAAVSLVGQYVVNSPEVANAFQPAFMIGLNDQGVSVRKRTIKILQEVLCNNIGFKGRSAACSEMLRLAADPKEDDGVRDAIHDLFLNIWFTGADTSFVQDIPSPSSPPAGIQSPSASETRVLEVNTVNGPATVTPATPPSPSNDVLSPAMRGTRSTQRRIKKKQLQLRSEIAVEQMVEVVKTANTGDHLTTLFRELLSGSTGTENGRKIHTRRKQRALAEDHTAMLVDSVFEILLRVEESRSGGSGASPNDVVAVMRTIRMFAEISPVDVRRHIDTILPYLKADNRLPFQAEAAVVTCLCSALSSVASALEKDDLKLLDSTQLATDLVNITYKFGKETLSAAVCTLCALAHHKYTIEESPFRASLLNLARTFYKYLSKHRDAKDIISATSKVKANVQRALSVLGSICRFHSIASEWMNDERTTVAPEKLSFSNMTSTFEDLFMTFLSKNDAQVKCAALRGLSGIFISHPREMLRMDQSGLISEVMSPDAPLILQLESLTCWRDILLTEEARIESGEAKAKMDSKTNITVSNKISGDQDADATLFGGVLTSHASRLFQMTQSSDKKLRFAALDLVGHLLRQGQINPNETVPYLLALQGDVAEESIRSLALKLLMVEGEKRPDMLRQRVYAGIKKAYSFQMAVYPKDEDASALVTIVEGNTSYTECVFGRVYLSCFATLKKQRRGLLLNLLNRFDVETRQRNDIQGRKMMEHSRDGNAPVDLPLLSFTAQVLAYLPYKVASDPLFIIYSINSALALRGPELLDRFASFLRPYGLSSDDDMEETNYREDALEIAAKRHVPTHAKEATPLLDEGFDIDAFSTLCTVAAAQILLLRLKAFLRVAYDLSESRIFAFNPDGKDERLEKAVSRSPHLVFDSKVIVYSTDGKADMADINSMIRQYAEFRKLMRAESGSESLDMTNEDELGHKRSYSSMNTSRDDELIT